MLQRSQNHKRFYPFPLSPPYVCIPHTFSVVFVVVIVGLIFFFTFRFVGHSSFYRTLIHAELVFPLAPFMSRTDEQKQQLLTVITTTVQKCCAKTH